MCTHLDNSPMTTITDGTFPGSGPGRTSCSWKDVSSSYTLFDKRALPAQTLRACLHFEHSNKAWLPASPLSIPGRIIVSDISVLYQFRRRDNHSAQVFFVNSSIFQSILKGSGLLHSVLRCTAPGLTDSLAFFCQPAFVHRPSLDTGTGLYYYRSVRYSI